MYMLAFVTLIVALTGVYAQVIALQTARFYASQTTVINAMSIWHAAAQGNARYAGITNVGGAAGCSLTSTNVAAGNLCKNAAGAAVTLDGAGPPAPACKSANNKGALTVSPCSISLPTGYNANYIFFSIYYQPTIGGVSTSYVITYVPPPTVTAANPDGLIKLPGTGATETEIGITMGDLMNQIKNASLPTLSYGTVSNAGVLVSGSVFAVGNIKYPLPTVVAIPQGSIAIISTPM